MFHWSIIYNFSGGNCPWLMVFMGDFVAADLMGIRPTILRIEAVKIGIMVQDGAPKIVLSCFTSG